MSYSGLVLVTKLMRNRAELEDLIRQVVVDEVQKVDFEDISKFVQDLTTKLTEIVVDEIVYQYHRLR